jgi:putative Mn2+ efflux pump MntP
MIVVHRGAGMMAPLFGILSALFMNIGTYRVLGIAYYEEHKWPKLAVLLLAGLGCLGLGLLLKSKRRRDAENEKQYIDSLSPKFESVKQIAYFGPRDHLMFIPLQYWSIVYFAAAIIYGFSAE